MSKGGCFTCGGPHYQQDCPQGKGVNGVAGDDLGEEVVKPLQEGLDSGGGDENWPDYFGLYETFAVDYEDGWQQVLRGGKTKKPEREVYAVNVKGDWEKITFTGDSGGVDHVIKKDTALASKTMETPMSKAGIGFTAANGSKINNYGAKKLQGVTNEGDGFNMQVQVTDAQRNLASFPKMVEEGSDEFLSKKGCWIKNEASGLKVPMRSKPGGTPEFDVFVKKASNEKVTLEGKGTPPRCEPCGQFSVLNENGEADIKDSDVMSAFTRLEMLI